MKPIKLGVHSVFMSCFGKLWCENNVSYWFYLYPHFYGCCKEHIDSVRSYEKYAVFSSLDDVKADIAMREL